MAGDQNASTPPATVLVVDDNPTNRDLLRRQLERRGFAVDAAGDGADALGLLGDRRYALVLCDLQMPGIDGYEFLARVAADAALARNAPCVVAVSANEPRASNPAFADHLMKPVSSAALTRILERFLGPQPAIKTPAANAATAAQPDTVFDPNTLGAVVGDDAALQANMLSDFALHTRSVMAEILAARETRDVATIGALAHQIKSSSLSVGAMAFGGLCAQLERVARQQESGDLAALISAMRRTLVDTESAIEHWVATRQSTRSGHP